MEYDVLRLLESPAETNPKDKETFFHVLGRTYDEDLISRVLVYVMNHDRAFVKALLHAYVEEACTLDVEACTLCVYPEKSMGKGRADIFAVLRQGNRVVATITIENKIFSTEHDNQTQTYYDWVYGQQEYRNAQINTFFYLRPAYNTSTAVCKAYQNITYTELYPLISQSDAILEDFKKHIQLYLGEATMEFSKKQVEIINNYERIREVIDEATMIYANVKNERINTVVKAIQEADREIQYEINEKTNPLGPMSVRLFKETWWKKDEYYFFAEMYFDEARMDKVKYQCVVKEYPKKGREGVIQRFLQTDLIPILSNDGQWHVWGSVYRFEPSSPWMSQEWREEFTKDAVEKLLDQIKEVDAMVQTFLNFP